MLGLGAQPRDLGGLGLGLQACCWVMRESFGNLGKKM
jgi:hypothetical protein